MNINIYNGIMLALMIMSLTVNLVKHGEYKTDERYNFFTALIGVAIEIFLLYKGGFF